MPINLPNLLTWLRILTIPLVIGVFYVGLYPRHIFEAAEEATKVLFV